MKNWTKLRALVARVGLGQLFVYLAQGLLVALMIYFFMTMLRHRQVLDKLEKAIELEEQLRQEGTATNGSQPLRAK